MPLSHPRRFTLVELLVVMAVLTILASLLLPSLQRALQAAREVACMSQMRQFHVVFHAYAEDHHGALINTYYQPVDDPSGSWGRQMWLAIMKDYAPEGSTDDNYFYFRKGLILCPADQRPASENKERSYGMSTFMGYNNYRVINNGLPAGHDHQLRPFQLDRPSRWILLAENPGDWPDGTKKPNWDPIATPGFDRHGDGMNFLHADGHVESAPVVERFSNPRVASIWNDHWVPPSCKGHWFSP